MPLAILPAERGGVEGLAVEEKAGGEVEGPARLDEIKVTAFVGAVELVPDDGMSRVGGVDADLMHPAGEGMAAEQGKAVAASGRFFETTNHLETRD